jgi:hypothetical protein
VAALLVGTVPQWTLPIKAGRAGANEG